MTENPYLRGNFAPVQEEITADGLEVVGELPRELSGIFLRNGPNPRFPPKGRYHWFDGDGMLHGLRLLDGKATYRNRYVRTRGFLIEQEEKKAIWSGLLEMPDFETPHGPFKNVANTALVWHDGRLLALWEAGEPYAVRLPELDTIGPYDYNGKLSSPFTAHPKVDPETGEMMFFGYTPMEEPYLYYSVVSARGELLRTVPVELPVGVMMHDFAITARYTIFLDLPLTFRLERAMQGEFPFAFEKDLPSRFGVLPRHGDPSEIRWFEGPSCYIWHTMNAYEEGDEIVLLGCRAESTSVLLPPEALSNGGSGFQEDEAGYLHRWRFNLATGEMKEEQVDDTISEFPRVNEDLLGRPTRYGYAGCISPESWGSAPSFDGLAKYDLARGSRQIHSFGKNRFGGEGIFVPRPGATAEDDGWVLTYVYDQERNASELIVISAQDFTAPPVARVLLPVRVPYGFHAAFVSEAQLASQKP